jgi:hypothetical protein
MAEPSIYESMAVAINGTLLVESTSIGVRYIGTDEVIPLLGMTIADAPRRGVVVAPGGRYMTVEVAEGRRIAGVTINVERLFIDATEVELTATMIGSGDALTTRGWIQAPSIQIAFGRAMQSGWSFVGYAAAFEGA